MAELSTRTIGLALALAAPAAAYAVPATPATPATAVAPATASYTTADTTIGALLADPAAKAILDKRIPGLADNPSIAMASGMTLRAIQPMAGDKITEPMLDALDADFKTLKPSAK